MGADQGGCCLDTEAISRMKDDRENNKRRAVAQRGVKFIRSDEKREEIVLRRG